MFFLLLSILVFLLPEPKLLVLLPELLILFPELEILAFLSEAALLPTLLPKPDFEGICLDGICLLGADLLGVGLLTAGR
jgi:hypothetical protein